MSAQEKAKTSPTDDTLSALSPEEKLEQAYQHVTEAMAMEGDDSGAAPIPETIGIIPPSAEQYERQIAETKDQMLRLAAEMENVRRRAQRDGIGGLARQGLGDVAQTRAGPCRERRVEEAAALLAGLQPQFPRGGERQGQRVDRRQGVPVCGCGRAPIAEAA